MRYLFGRLLYDFVKMCWKGIEKFFVGIIMLTWYTIYYGIWCLKWLIFGTGWCLFKIALITFNCFVFMIKNIFDLYKKND